jgi:hypothetical protein
VGGGDDPQGRDSGFPGGGSAGELSPRIGKSKISGTFKGTVGAAWFIVSRILRYSLRKRRAGAREPVRSSEAPRCK